MLTVGMHYNASVTYNFFLTSRRATVSVVKKSSSDITRFSAAHCPMSGANIDSHLCNIINKGPQNSSFPDAAKIALVRPIYKKKCRNTIENHRPVSVLNTFSKIYERYIHNSLIPYINKCLSEFVAPYRKCYSSSHVLIRLVEN